MGWHLTAPRLPEDDLERDAVALTGSTVPWYDVCYDSMPPEHDECLRENGHDGDHVAVRDGLVVARWNDADWVQAYQALTAGAPGL